MAEQNNHVKGIVYSMMEGVGTALASRTVVGEPVTVGDTTIIPLSDITIGCGAGADNADKKDMGLGGFSAKLSPNAVLIIRGGNVRVVNIKTQDAISKLVDLIPDVVERFAAGREEADVMGEDEAVERAFPGRNAAARS